MALDTLWYTRCPLPTAFGVAVDLGLLEREFAGDGIEIRSLASSADASVRESHFHHSQSNSLRHGGNGPPLVTRSRGGDLKIIGMSWNDSFKTLLALPQSGIRAMADLAGRRVSIPLRSGDSIDFWRAAALRGLEVALRSAGMSMESVVPTPVCTDRPFMEGASASASATATLFNASFMLGHQREEAFALIRGEVDAFYSQGAIAVIVQGFTGAVALAANAGTDPGDRVNNDAPLVFTASGKLLDERPDLVNRVMACVLQAAQWARTHEREAKRIIAADSGLAEELVDRAFSPGVHDQLEVDLRQEWIEALRIQHEHLLRHGFLEKPVDFDAFIDHRALDGARELLARRRPCVA